VGAGGYERGYRLLSGVRGSASEAELQRIVDWVRGRYFASLNHVAVEVRKPEDFGGPAWAAHYNIETKTIQLTPAAATGDNVGDVLLHELCHAACDARGKACPDINKGHHEWFFLEVCRLEETYGLTINLQYIFACYRDTPAMYSHAKLSWRIASAQQRQSGVAAPALEIGAGPPVKDKIEESLSDKAEEEDEIYSVPFGEFNLLYQEPTNGSESPEDNENNSSDEAGGEQGRDPEDQQGGDLD
jgi:hypothetical protein